MKQTIDPIFNENFSFEVAKDEMKNKSIEVISIFLKNKSQLTNIRTEEPTYVYRSDSDLGHFRFGGPLIYKFN